MTNTLEDMLILNESMNRKRKVNLIISPSIAFAYFQWTRRAPLMWFHFSLAIIKSHLINRKYHVISLQILSNICIVIYYLLCAYKLVLSAAISNSISEPNLTKFEMSLWQMTIVLLALNWKFKTHSSIRTTKKSNAMFFFISTKIS